MKQDKIFVNKSLRLKEYDYNHPGAYFVMICVFKRKCVFGEVVKEKMNLNELGKIADACLTQIPTHFKNSEIGEYIVMPNHVHAVIYIFDEAFSDENKSVGRRHACDSQGHALDLQGDRKNQKLFVITGSYKSAVSKAIRKFHPLFRWQTSFHDHIIRNEKALANICEYIRQNPANWDKDFENETFANELSPTEREKRIKQFYKKLTE